MGHDTGKHDHARGRYGQGGAIDRRQAPPRLRRSGRRRVSGGLISLLALLVLTTQTAAETIRIASYNTDLSRNGPGLLLRDILKGKDARIAGVMQVITAAKADILVLQNFDYDLNNTALNAFADALAAAGRSYPWRFSAPPNVGRMTDLDLDGDGKKGGPGDAQGYGRFFGQGSMAILSRYPIVTTDVQDFSDLLWRDLPGATLPHGPDGPFPSAEALAIQRLSTTAHWVVPVQVPDIGTLHLLTFHAAPPVFDGPENRNGKRNHDEVRFWSAYLAGAFQPPPKGRFVLLGAANLDPDKGDGIGAAIKALLTHPMLSDPLPGLPTVDWPAPGPGPMRVDYVLPSADWAVTGAGLADQPTPAASRHRLVWVDLAP